MSALPGLLRQSSDDVVRIQNQTPVGGVKLHLLVEKADVAEHCSAVPVAEMQLTSSTV